MQTNLYREELRAEGTPEPAIKEGIAKGYDDGRPKVPVPGFLCMMSNESYVHD
jgi:hypothetical protein